MRFEVGNTHAYSGCRVRVPQRPAHADAVDCIIEFSDGVVASGTCAKDADTIALHIPAYRTARGTDIVAKSWLLHPDGAPEQWRISRQLAR